MTNENISFGAAPLRSKVKDAREDVLTDRIRQLTEELNGKKTHFQKISKEYFTVQQDYLTKSSYLKELKSDAAKSLNDYVKIVTETALKDSDYTYKEYVLQKKTELAAYLIEEKYLTLHNLRKSLEDAVHMYSDCRRNLKKYQSKLSAVTDDARIDTLNMVAFCRYSQSVIGVEVQKLPRHCFLSSKNVSATKQINSSRCNKSIEELKHFYLEHIAKLRRDETLLTNRLSTSLLPQEEEPFSAISDPRPQSSTNTNSNRYYRGRTPLLFTNSRNVGQKQDSSNGKSSLSVNPRASIELSAFSSCSDGSDDEKKQSSNKVAHLLPLLPEQPIQKGMKKKKRSKRRPATTVLFDKANFVSDLFAAVGVRVDDLHYHHGRVSEQQADSAVEHTLRENSLLQRDQRSLEQDRKLAQLASITSALEGKHRELFCVKEVVACIPFGYGNIETIVLNSILIS